MAFKTFLHLFDKTWDEHALFEHVNLEEQKEAVKHWVTTPGIKNQSKSGKNCIKNGKRKE